MPDDLIRYDLLVQDALRGVVRKVLSDAARDGLAGEHHFYVSFRTEAPGVRMSQALRDKYPQDMTIVLQHQFWDLAVTEHTFEVGLSFSGVPERLLVPFDALSGFFDPSVQFGLKFDLSETANEGQGEAARRGAAPEPEAKPKAPGTSLAAIGAGAPKGLPAPAAKPLAAPAAKAEEPKRPAARKDGEREAAERKPGEEAGAEVVSLDAFRKKN